MEELPHIGQTRALLSRTLLYHSPMELGDGVDFFGLPIPNLVKFKEKKEGLAQIGNNFKCLIIGSEEDKKRALKAGSDFLVTKLLIGGKYLDSIRTSTTSLTALIISVVRGKKFSVEGADIDHKKAEALQNMGLEKFVDQFGCHYISGVITGGIFVASIEYTFDSIQEKTEFAVRAKASFKLFFGDIGMGAKEEVKRTEVIEKKNIKIAVDLFVSGAWTAGTPNTLEELLLSHSEFIKSAKESCNSPIMVECLPIANLPKVQEMKLLETFMLYRQVGEADTAEGKYFGEFICGKPKGYGRYTSATGDVWEGEFSSGCKSCDNGIFYSASTGNRFKGKWKNYDEWIDGEGLVHYESGATYEGHFNDDQASGFGVYCWTDSSRYEGEFHEWNRNGFGKYWWADGKRYEGYYKDDKADGKGTYYATDGSHFEGEFKEGLLSRGTYWWPDGSRFEGKWKDEKMWKGIMYRPNGNKEEWLNGEPKHNCAVF